VGVTGDDAAPFVRGDGLRLAIVASRFNHAITEALLEGALAELDRRGVERSTVRVAWVPGALELPLVAQRLATSGDYDAVICLGAVVRGETDHHVHVGTQAAAGVMRVQLDSGVPVSFGVLTTDTEAAAAARAGGERGNRGADAAAAAVETADLLGRLPKGFVG